MNFAGWFVAVVVFVDGLDGLGPKADTFPRAGKQPLPPHPPLSYLSAWAPHHTPAGRQKIISEKRRRKRACKIMLSAWLAATQSERKATTTTSSPPQGPNTPPRPCTRCLSFAPSASAAKREQHKYERKKRQRKKKNQGGSWWSGEWGIGAAVGSEGASGSRRVAGVAERALCRQIL